MNLISPCPVCDAQIGLNAGIEESEIVDCPDCRVRLVAGAREGNTVPLTPAPEIEEDWGE